MQSSHNSSVEKIQRKRKNDKHLNQGNPYRDKRRQKRKERHS